VTEALAGVTVGADELTHEQIGGVLLLTLNRPERRNALTPAMIAHWVELLEHARTDASVRAVVVTGAGTAFCSGAELGDESWANASAVEVKERLFEGIHRVAFALEDLDKPVIAAINGAAVGAGLDMALLCDIRFADADAKLSEGYVRAGIVPGDGGCFLLPRLIGPAKALELLWTGDAVSGEEAAVLGIVNRAVAPGTAVEEAMAFAQRLAEGPTVAIRMMKRAVYQSLRMDLRSSFDLISSHMAVVHATADAQEALVAFGERRSPRFRGE
jgi:enoyl-CoA hydratase/carnithine racemase